MTSSRRSLVKAAAGLGLVACGAGFWRAAHEGVFDVGESMRGYVELGGGWTTDGARNFMGGALRFGLVPTVPRFKG